MTRFMIYMKLAIEYLRGLPLAAIKISIHIITNYSSDFDIILIPVTLYHSLTYTIVILSKRNIHRQHFLVYYSHRCHRLTKECISRIPYGSLTHRSVVKIIATTFLWVLSIKSFGGATDLVNRD